MKIYPFFHDFFFQAHYFGRCKSSNEYTCPIKKEAEEKKIVGRFAASLEE